MYIRTVYKLLICKEPSQGRRSEHTAYLWVIDSLYRASMGKRIVYLGEHSPLVYLWDNYRLSFLFRLMYSLIYSLCASLLRSLHSLALRLRFSTVSPYKLPDDCFSSFFTLSLTGAGGSLSTTEGLPLHFFLCSSFVCPSIKSSQSGHTNGCINLLMTILHVSNVNNVRNVNNVNNT